MPTYSRGEIVSTLTTFYQFLTTMYIPNSDVLHAPPGGWPHITKETFAFLRKNDRVVDLLRHIPYVRRDSQHDIHQVEELCVMIDYRNRGRYSRFEPLEEICTIPAHVVTLAEPWKSVNGAFLLLDTNRATITHYCPQFRTPFTKLSQV